MNHADQVAAYQPGLSTVSPDNPLRMRATRIFLETPSSDSAHPAMILRIRSKVGRPFAGIPEKRVYPRPDTWLPRLPVAEDTLSSLAGVGGG